VTRLLATLLALTSCASPALTLTPPSSVDGRAVRWERAYLPAGVVAEADLETQTVTLAPGWSELPPEAQWVVLAHELCHLRGYTTEAGADCCAADAVARLCGRAWVLEGAVWLQARGYDVTMLVECVP